MPTDTPGQVPSPRKQVLDEPPPFLGSWPRVYLMVLGYLAVLIAVFSAFTRWFAP